jgi:hypothetical protein
MKIKTSLYGLISALFLNVFTSYGLITEAVFKQHAQQPDHLLILLSDTHIRRAETERQKKQVVEWGAGLQKSLDRRPSPEDKLYFVVEDQMKHPQSADPVLSRYIKEWIRNKELADRRPGEDDDGAGPAGFVDLCERARLQAIDVDFRGLKGALEDSRIKCPITPTDFQKLYQEQYKIISSYQDTPFLNSYYKDIKLKLAARNAPIMEKLYSFESKKMEFIPQDLYKALLSSEFEDELIDIHTAHEVYKNRHCKFIVVYLGGAHLDNLENAGIWDHLGYKTVFSMGAAAQLPLGEALWTTEPEREVFFGKYLRHIRQNPVDLELFFRRVLKLRLQDYTVFKTPMDDVSSSFDRFQAKVVKEIGIAEAKAEEEEKLRADEVEIIAETRKRKQPGVQPEAGAKRRRALRVRVPKSCIVMAPHSGKRNFE